MILQALAGYYERLLQKKGAEGIAPPGYSPEKISYEIVLAADGCMVAVNDIRDTSGKKPRPRTMIVPQPPKRSSNVAPCFLWDKSAYVLGVSATSKRSKQEHAAFKALHLERLKDANDTGLQAMRAFLQSWVPDQYARAGFTEDMLDANMVFRLDGEQQWLHERPAAHTAWLGATTTESETDPLPCLVTGKEKPAALLHPAIKGVRGAQSSGASIVSFNLDSFTSYGKAQGANAPVSKDAAFAYTTALNYLLRPSEHNRQKLLIGDTTVVFWAEADNIEQAEDAELAFGLLLNGPIHVDDNNETTLISDMLKNVADGRPLSDLNPNLHGGTRMYVLGLAPNASRLSIRFWEVNSLDGFAQRFAQHARDFQIEPTPWNTAPSAWRVVLATVPNRAGAKPRMDDAAANLVGEFLRAVLSGGPYPHTLLANTLMRIRSDHTVSGLRAAICKAIPSRERRLGLHLRSEEPPVSLNKQSTHPGYRLGRLFSVLEDAQRGALGGHVNATIRDRYYGAASATPASVFPILLRNAQNHLSKLRKEKPGFAVNLEKDITEIIGGLPETFPRSLPIEGQGQFAVGYYHQSQARFQKATKEANITNTEEPSA